MSLRRQASPWPNTQTWSRACRSRTSRSCCGFFQKFESLPARTRLKQKCHRGWNCGLRWENNTKARGVGDALNRYRATTEGWTSAIRSNFRSVCVLQLDVRFAKNCSGKSLCRVSSLGYVISRWRTKRGRFFLQLLTKSSTLCHKSRGFSVLKCKFCQ